MIKNIHLRHLPFLQTLLSYSWLVDLVFAKTDSNELNIFKWTPKSLWFRIRGFFFCLKFNWKPRIHENHAPGLFDMFWNYQAVTSICFIQQCLALRESLWWLLKITSKKNISSESLIQILLVVNFKSSFGFWPKLLYFL